MSDFYKKALEKSRTTSIASVEAIQEAQEAVSKLTFDTVSSGTQLLSNPAKSKENIINNIFSFDSAAISSNNFFCSTDIFYTGSLQYFIDRDYKKGNSIPTQGDKFRFVSKKYWTSSDSLPRFSKVGMPSGIDVPFDIVFGEEVYKEDLTSEVKIKLINKKKNGLGERFIWNAYINGSEPQTFNITTIGEVNIPAFDSIIPQGTFYDFSFINSPIYNKKQVESLTDGYQNVFDFKCNYNFYVKNYEDVTKDSAVNENLIPNIYCITVENNKVLSSDDEIHKFNTLNNRITREIQIISGSVKNGLTQIYNLFDQWSRKIGTITTSEKSELVNLNKNLVFSLNEIEGKLINEVEEVSALYPIQVKANLDIRENSELSEVIKNSRSDKSILNKIVDSNIIFKNTEIVGFSKALGISNQPFVVYDSLKNNFIQDNIKSWDFLSLIDKKYVEQDSYKTKIDAYDPTFKEISDSIFSSIYPAILKINLNKLIKKYDRKFEEILSGKPAHADTIAYRISKYEVNNFGKINIFEPIQNYYFNNSSELQKFDFTDTQVKYGKRYKYVIFSYQAVFGNSYSYDIINVSNDDADILVKKQPKIRLYEIPIFESDSINIRDSAPIEPEMKFSTYINDSKTLMISLERAIGEYKAKPVQINRTDAKFIFRMSDEEGNVSYDGDDNIEYFELYKTSSAPKDYKDFGQPYKIIKTSTAENEFARTPEVTVIDKLMPNEKYYYFSRAIDVHNNLSNPSLIYEIEIVNNSGAIYPIIRNYEFPKPKKNKFKKVNKYVRIYPSYQQTEINVSDDININIKNLKLGGGDSIWDKRFKFRFTSNNTGKKIDFDVRFKYYTKGYLFEFISEGVATAIVANSFSEALSLLLIEQNTDLI